MSKEMKQEMRDEYNKTKALDEKHLNKIRKYDYWDGGDIIPRKMLQEPDEHLARWYGTDEEIIRYMKETSKRKYARDDRLKQRQKEAKEMLKSVDMNKKIQDL